MILAKHVCAICVSFRINNIKKAAFAAFFMNILCGIKKTGKEPVLKDVIQG